MFVVVAERFLSYILNKYGKHKFQQAAVNGMLKPVGFKTESSYSFLLEKHY